MGARETLPNPGVDSLFLDVIDQLKRRDEIVAQTATDQIAAMKAQIDSEILPQLGDFMPKTGGTFSGSIGVIHDAEYAYHAIWRKYNRRFDICTLADGMTTLRVNDANWSGPTFPLGIYASELFFNGANLGRWAAIDPNSLMPKSGGILSGHLTILDSANIYWDTAKIGAFQSGGNLSFGNYKDGRWGILDITPDARLLHGGHDLGRWAYIDPANVVSTNYAALGGVILTATLTSPHGWGDWRAAGAAFNIESMAGDFQSAYTLMKWSSKGSHWCGSFSFLPGWDEGASIFTLAVGPELFMFHGTGYLDAKAFSAKSDKRKKRDFSMIESALSKLDSINGYLYSWIDTGKPAAGLVAQEVETILPVAVSENDGVKSLDYNAVVALLVNAVRELKTEVRALKGA